MQKLRSTRMNIPSHRGSTIAWQGLTERQAPAGPADPIGPTKRPERTRQREQRGLIALKSAVREDDAALQASANAVGASVTRPIDVVRAVAPLAKPNYIAAFQHGSALLAQHEINTPLRLAHFLAQILRKIRRTAH